MATHHASCQCGQLSLEADGDPIRISMCHCLACQRRTGSAFGIQARWEEKNVRTEGRANQYTRISDGGEARTFSFCPECGSTVFYTTESVPGVVAVAIGALADPTFPPPRISVWESRRHPWVTVPEPIEHHE
jgi:hypothetical protein